MYTLFQSNQRKHINNSLLFSLSCFSVLCTLLKRDAKLNIVKVAFMKRTKVDENIIGAPKGQTIFGALSKC